MPGLLALLMRSAGTAARKANKAPTEYVSKAYNRVLAEAEALASINGGRLPTGYKEEIAVKTGYAPEMVKKIISESRIGEHGRQLQSRAATIGGAPNNSSAMRKRVAELMDTGLGPTDIMERMGEAGPSSYGSARALMSQVRRKRRETGDPSAYALPLGLLGLMQYDNQQPGNA